jgi:hypothetical protein
VIALRDESGLHIASALSVAEAGFSLHAATTASADDARAREGLCKYVLRPPLAQERLRLLDDGLVRVELKRPFSDGTVAVDMDPLSLLCRLAAAVHPPKFHVVRYAGILASAHHLRSLVVPPLADENKIESAHAHASDNERSPTHRCGYRPWAEWMKRSFAIEVDNCEKCGAAARTSERASPTGGPSRAGAPAYLAARTYDHDSDTTDDDSPIATAPDLTANILAALDAARVPQSREALRAALRVKNDRLGVALRQLELSGSVERTARGWRLHHSLPSLEK